MREPALSPLQAAYAGAINPVMKLLASVDALHANTSQCDKHVLHLPPLYNVPLLLYSNALSGALYRGSWTTWCSYHPQRTSAVLPLFPRQPCKYVKLTCAGGRVERDSAP